MRTLQSIARFLYRMTDDNAECSQCYIYFNPFAYVTYRVKCLSVPVPTRAMVNFPKELAMRLKIKRPVTFGVFCNIRHTCKSQNGSVFVPNLCPRGRSHVHLDSLCETSDTDVKLEKCARMLTRLVSCLIEVGRKTKHDVTGR